MKRKFSIFLGSFLAIGVIALMIYGLIVFGFNWWTTPILIFYVYINIIGGIKAYKIMNKKPDETNQFDNYTMID